jgi:mannose-6-phosphate isomerase-like protein (cupin superfamily)
MVVKIVTFGEQDSGSIDRFDSRLASVSHLARLDGAGSVVAIRVGAGGKVGRHPAVKAQRFVVVEGSGVVSGADGDEVAIATGQAALWEAGEHHESSSSTGMRAIVIEVDGITGA